MGLFFGIDTETKWIQDIGTIPVIGTIFLFVLVFVPAVLLSFIIQSITPALHNDIGFTKAMLVLLPVWNLGLWIGRIKIFMFFIPAWILLGVIAAVKTYLMIRGIDNGQ
jgi:hypothetical protein